MDRIVTDGYIADDFNDLIDRVEQHFAMVFHRLIQGPMLGLEFSINGKPVVPWDPFYDGPCRENMGFTHRQDFDAIGYRRGRMPRITPP